MTCDSGPCADGATVIDTQRGDAVGVSDELNGVVSTGGHGMYHSGT